MRDLVPDRAHTCVGVRNALDDALSMVTGKPPKVGDQRTLTERELRTDAAREAR